MLDIPMTQGEILMDRIALGIMIGIVLYTLINFTNLPARIPIHWNAKGLADSFGSRYWLLLQPVLSVVFFFGLTKLCEYPHKFNYLTRLTEANVEQEYLRGRRLLRIVNIGCQIIFAIILFTTVRAASGGDQNLGKWFVPVVIISSFLPLVYAIIMSMKQN